MSTTAANKITASPWLATSQQVSEYLGAPIQKCASSCLASSIARLMCCSGYDSIQTSDKGSFRLKRSLERQALLKHGESKLGKIRETFYKAIYFQSLGKKITSQTLLSEDLDALAKQKIEISITKKENTVTDPRISSPIYLEYEVQTSKPCINEMTKFVTAFNQKATEVHEQLRILKENDEKEVALAKEAAEKIAANKEAKEVEDVRAKQDPKDAEEQIAADKQAKPAEDKVIKENDSEKENKTPIISAAASDNAPADKIPQRAKFWPFG